MARTPLSPSPSLQGSSQISTNSSMSRPQLPNEKSTEQSEQFAPLDRKPSFLSERSSSTTTASNSQGTYSTEASIRSIASSSRIRSRYLFKLGVIGVEPGSCSASASPMALQSLETLQRSLGQTDSEGSSRRHSTAPTLHSSRPQEESTNSARVRFHTHVQVHPIPHHNDYSSETKRTLWMSPAELEEMAYRNYFEFASEHWDWRQAVEEEDFCLFAGAWTHPAHVTRYTPSRQFCMIRSAQQQQQQQKRFSSSSTQQHRLRAW